YSFHDHYDELGLIDMKGRLYDPLLAQMLSPDRFVGADNRADGYNRYNYVFNNPLKYVDITGNHPEHVKHYRDWQFAQRYDFQVAQGNSRYTQKLMYEYSASSRDPSVQQYSQWVDYKSNVDLGIARQIKHDHLSRLTLGMDAQPVGVSYTSMFGNNGRVFDAMSSFVPVFGGVTGFANYARAGNAPMAVLNLALGISEFSAFGITGTSRAATTSVAERSAVSMADNLVYSAESNVSRGAGLYGSSGQVGRSVVSPSIYMPENQLAQQKVAGWDIPLPDPLANSYAHTTLGYKLGSDGVMYRQSAEFTGGSWPLANGQIVPISRVDWTTHGRPMVHPNPHQHIFYYNGSNWSYGSAAHFR
ncbi:MAG TPA: RHS repeat-associated core domain-containing protein, partial [Cytophagales bacterium]|nr:RHS repeat-associated core domain-containing protein [Cytophagales bacterium]